MEVWGKYEEINCSSVKANSNHSLGAQMRNFWEQMTFPLLHRDMPTQQITAKVFCLKYKRLLWIKSKSEGAFAAIPTGPCFQVLCKIQVQKHQGVVNTAYTSRDPVAPHYQKQLPSQTFQPEFCQEKSKIITKSRALTRVCLGASFRRHFLFPMFQLSICFPFPGIPAFHKYFWYMSGSLRMRKITLRRPSCPAEHSRQGYSGSHYSNKVCDINKADVKSLLTLYKILWESVTGPQPWKQSYPLSQSSSTPFPHPIRTSLTFKSNYLILPFHQQNCVCHPV